MHFVVYVSAASHLMSEAGLLETLAVSRARNMADGISGMLLHKDGSFMQVLEGARDSVVRTYARIGRDKRHHGLMTLGGGEIAERGYPGGSMGFRTVKAADLEAVPGFARLGGQTFTSPKIAAKPHVAVRMLRTFDQTTR